MITLEQKLEFIKTIINYYPAMQTISYTKIEYLQQINGILNSIDQQDKYHLIISEKFSSKFMLKGLPDAIKFNYKTNMIEESIQYKSIKNNWYNTNKLLNIIKNREEEYLKYGYCNILEYNINFNEQFFKELNIENNCIRYTKLDVDKIYNELNTNLMQYSKFILNNDIEKIHNKGIETFKDYIKRKK